MITVRLLSLLKDHESFEPFECTSASFDGQQFRAVVPGTGTIFIQVPEGAAYSMFVLESKDATNSQDKSRNA